jgi:general secretion pathway protein D
MRTLSAILSLCLLYGCAADRMHKDGNSLIEAGLEEEGIGKLEKASEMEPGNLQFKLDLIKRRKEIDSRLYAEATREHGQGRLEKAARLYQKILRIDPTHERAQEGLRTLEQDMRHAVLIDEAKSLLDRSEPERALEKLRIVAEENPENVRMLELRKSAEAQLNIPGDFLRLDPSHQKRITLEFKDASAKAVFDAITRASGVDFVLEKDIRPDMRITVQANQQPFDDLLSSIMRDYQLEKKVLSPNSMMIYPNSPDKVKRYQELVVKAFYLANANAKETMNMVRTLFKLNDTYVDERLNMMVIRDTPDAIRLVEKLVALQDISDPEVMLEVEVLEVSRSRLVDLGVSVPNQLTLTPLSKTLNELRQLNDTKIGASIGPVIANLRKEDGNVNILANPRIRTKNHEKAKILIGDKLPVITTTSTATGFVSESVQYLDVGLKLDVEPAISLRDDVTIKLNLEVSSIVQQIKSASGTVTYQIGTRSAGTVLQLKDGETQVLAGLINDEDRSTASRIPGLGDFPVLGRLFSSQQDNSRKTEVILSITPHLIRGLQRPTLPKQTFWSGSETALQDYLPPTPIKQVTDMSRDKTPPAPEALEAKGADKRKGVTFIIDAPEKVSVGDTFKVTVKVSSTASLHGLPFELTYAPDSLQFVGANEGPFLKQNGRLTEFSSNVDAARGTISVSALRAGADGATGEDVIASFEFKALAIAEKSEVAIAKTTPITTSAAPIAVKMPPPYDIAIESKAGDE